MTALVFVLQPEAVVVAMDTLAVRAQDKLPHKYCSKILPLPHLMSAICGTGSHRLALDWYTDVQTNILARDVDYISEVAPERLRELWSKSSDPGTSTIYHFGFSREAHAFTGAAFRSTADFVREPLGYGIGIKPAVEEVALTAEATLDQLGHAGGVVDLMVRLRTADDAAPLHERVGLGGEVHLLLMSELGQYTQVVEHWPDCGAAFEEMLDRLHESVGQEEVGETGV